MIGSYYLVVGHQFMRSHPALARIRDRQADALFLKYLEQHQ